MALGGGHTALQLSFLVLFGGFMHCRGSVASESCINRGVTGCDTVLSRDADAAAGITRISRQDLRLQKFVVDFRKTTKLGAFV